MTYSNDATRLDATRSLAPNEFQTVKAQLRDAEKRVWSGHGSFRVVLWEQPGLQAVDPDDHADPAGLRKLVETVDALSERTGTSLEVRCRTFLPIDEDAETGVGSMEERLLHPVVPFRSYLLLEDGVPVLDEPFPGELLRRACMRAPEPDLLVLEHRPYLTSFFPPEEDDGIDEDAPYAFDVDVEPSPPLRAGVVVNHGYLELHNRFLVADILQMGSTLVYSASVDWHATFAPEGHARLVERLTEYFRIDPGSTVRQREFLEKLLKPHGISLVDLQLDLLT